MVQPLLKRTLWHLTRSPLGPAYKKTLRLINPSIVNGRIELGNQLPKSQAAIAYADHLNREGYVVISDGMDKTLLAALDTAAMAKITDADQAAAHQTLTHKSFWTRLTDTDLVDGKMPISSPYVQFATQPAVLEILTQAFGEIPFLDYVLLTLSHHTPSERIYSQLWHRDHDDVRVIKLFVYLTDVVDEKDGPFTFIPGPVSDRYGFARHSHRDDDKIFANGLAGEADVKVMIAPRLSVFMVETTRCLHMGSRVAPDHMRLLYTATYMTVPSMFPNRKNRFSADRPVRDIYEQTLLDL